ncbi:MAG: hypothetical protein PF636_07690, partial [Actinomycetota bacterium]|nr:hypothetical protein [Actinomycetota bacterium]
MAEVYKAVDEVLGRTVAIKVLHSRYASDAAFVARFRQEAQAAANLSRRTPRMARLRAESEVVRADLLAIFE